MMLRVVPEGLAAAAAAIEALALQMSAAEAANTAVTGIVAPPAADPVSVRAAAGLSAYSAHHSATATAAIAELSRSGVGLGESGVSYATGDAEAAATYLA